MSDRYFCKKLGPQSRHKQQCLHHTCVFTRAVFARMRMHESPMVIEQNLEPAFSFMSLWHRGAGEKTICARPRCHKNKKNSAIGSRRMWVDSLRNTGSSPVNGLDRLLVIAGSNFYPCSRWLRSPGGCSRRSVLADPVECCARSFRR